jgi:hypothetical protein
MMGFRNVHLQGDQLRVVGRANISDGSMPQRIDYRLAQAGVAVQGEGRMSGQTGWSGEGDAGGIQVGPAFAFGLVQLTTPQEPPGFQTFTWFEEVEVTTE